MRILTYILLFGFCTLNLVGVAQNFHADLAKINAKYEKVKSVSYSITLSSYMDSISGEAVDVNKIKIIQDGETSYQKIGDFEILKTPKYSISVNHLGKTISYSESYNSFDPSEMDAVNTTKVLENSKVETFKKISGKSYMYMLSNEKSIAYNRAKLFFDPQTFLIQRLEIYYRLEVEHEFSEDHIIKGKPIMIMDFENYAIGDLSTSYLLLKNRYIILKEGEYVAVNRLKGYSVFTGEVNEDLIKVANGTK